MKLAAAGYETSSSRSMSRCSAILRARFSALARAAYGRSFRAALTAQEAKVVIGQGERFALTDAESVASLTPYDPRKPGMP